MLKLDPFSFKNGALNEEGETNYENLEAFLGDKNLYEVGFNGSKS